MKEVKPQLQTSGDMGQEPPRVVVGTAMEDDKVGKVLELITQMDAGELRELQAGYISLLGL